LSTICDELIALMGSQVKARICEEIQQAKYYSISLDSTPDVSHTDQVTFTVRYVGVKGEPVERFLEFIASEERHTGENLRDIVLSALSRLNLNIEDLRGQSYDNAANMSGCYSGLQANIKQINSLADFVPCAAHSLNLVGTASVSSCLEAIKFFGIVHEIYNFAVRSTRHWNVLTNGLRSNENGRILTLKTLSSTRWHCHAESVKALALNYDNFYSLLLDIADNNDESADAKLTAHSLANALSRLETAVMCQLWCKILLRFQASSTALQGTHVDLQAAVALFDSLKSFVCELREQFEDIETAAKSMMPSVVQSYASETSRSRKRKRLADDSSTPAVTLSGADNFRVNTYCVIVDKLLSALCQRREAYQQLAFDYAFVNSLVNCDASAIAQFREEVIAKYPTDLDRSCHDEFVQFLKYTIELKIDRQPITMLKHLLNEPFMSSCFPNVTIALRLYLTLPVTVCEGERSFSRLALIKNRLRSCLQQDKLNALAVLAIESDIVRDMSFDDVVSKFCHTKVRKKSFKRELQTTVSPITQ